jgi:hypothetical protein
MFSNLTGSFGEIMDTDPLVKPDESIAVMRIFSSEE